MQPDPRDELFDALHYGRTTPEEAEAEAKRLELAPLAEQPDPVNFNPMEEPWWTLPMVVAWIAWRSPAEVRDVWDDYRLRRCDWQFRKWRVGFDGPIYDGYFLEYWKPATLASLALTEIFRKTHGTLPKDAISIRDAKAKLWKALSEGAIQATGRKQLASRAVIPEYEWRDLVDFEERGRDVVRQGVHGTVELSGYNDLAFKRHLVMSIWQSNRMERGLYLPETIAPAGPGHMPLYCAAQWIATQGGKVNFEPTSALIWERAYSELIARISSNEVTVTGMGGGVRSKLEGHLFASIAIAYPFADTAFDLILSDELYLQSYVFLDDEHWRKGFDDSLQDRQGTHWSQLMVPKSDIARWWPFSTEPMLDQASSGAPGRPTSMHLVTLEYSKRWERGDVHKKIGDEAKVLAAWLIKTHPTSPRLTAKTITNNLRAEHRQRWHDARK